MAIDSMLTSIDKQLDREYLKPVTLNKIENIVQEEAVLAIGQESFMQSELSRVIAEIR
jgi:hypothetical protein